MGSLDLDVDVDIKGPGLDLDVKGPSLDLDVDVKGGLDLDVSVKGPSLDLDVDIKGPGLDLDVNIKGPGLDLDVKGPSLSMDLDVKVGLDVDLEVKGGLDLDVDVKGPSLDVGIKGPDVNVCFSKAEEISPDMPDVLVEVCKSDVFSDSLIQIRQMMGQRDIVWKKVKCFLACSDLEMEDDQVAALECVLTEHKFEEDPIEKATWDQGMRV